MYKDTIVALEENSLTDHFTKNAAHTPNIHVLVIAHAQDDLGCAIVPRYNVRCEHETRRTGSPRQSKVQDLQRAIGANDNVGRLEILRCAIDDKTHDINGTLTTTVNITMTNYSPCE